ncbi:molybdate transporter 1 [Actinidia rufa]|uniref:Molybdate transporter 1 n=1 Tax=Actinidia rufa TaxID=165716 RepID=A0A7J0DHY8_9ERIC|nr:molybdate transporter 1 [Actinidia rufa]
MESQNPPPQTPQETAVRPPASGFPTTVIEKLKTNLAFRSKWGELNGAMGDLGTYVPIVLALTLAKDLNLGTTLIFTGIYNIVTGAIYGVPMPVQPMKSISAVAISTPDFGIQEAMAAGIWTAAILFVLGVTGLMQLVYKLIPLSVVRGIQLAQGLSFAMTSIKYIRKVQDFSKSKASGERHWLGLDGLILALFCACFIIIINGAGDENEERGNDCDLGYNSTIALVDSELGRGGVQVVVGSFSGEGGFLGHVGVRDSGADEPGGVLVWGHAMLPWGWWAGWAVQVWWEEWWLCGPAWGCQVGLGLGIGQLLGEGFGPVSSWGIGGSSVICWNRVSYVLKRHELQGRVLCYASVHGRFASGLERSPGISLWDFGPFPS